jgi:acyl-homoserine lactone acylase PvdQ
MVMDQVTRKAVEERARALWQEAGSPKGDTLRYQLRAEVELGVIPEAEAQQGDDRGEPREGDPVVQASDRDRPTQADDPLQRSVDAAVPTAEQLPRGAEENPLSQHVEHAAGENAPQPGATTFQGGDAVER